MSKCEIWLVKKILRTCDFQRRSVNRPNQSRSNLPKKWLKFVFFFFFV